MISNNKYAKEVAYYIPAKLGPAFLSLLLITIITKNLEPSAYGNYATIITILNILVQIFGVWISNSLMYIAANNEIKEDEVVNKIFTFQVINAFIMSSIAFGVTYIYGYGYSTSIAAIFIALNQAIYGYFMSVLQLRREISQQTIAGIMLIGVQLINILIIKSQEININKLLVGVAVSYMMANAYIFFMCRVVDIKNYSMKIDFELVKKIISYGLPMCLWFFATQFYIFGDRLFLKAYGHGDELGKYSAFKDLFVGVLSLVSMPILMASHPILLKAWNREKNITKIQSIININIKILTLIFMPIIVVIYEFGPIIINFLLGENYLIDKKIMVIVVLSIYLTSVSMHLQRSYELTGKTMLMAKNAMMACLVFFVINILIVRQYSTLGSSFSVLFAAGFYALISFQSQKKLIKVKVNYRENLNIIVYSGLIFVLANSLHFWFNSSLNLDFFLMPYSKIVILAVGFLYLYINNILKIKNIFMKTDF